MTNIFLNTRKYFVIGGISLGVVLCSFWLFIEISCKQTIFYKILEPFLECFDRYFFAAICHYLNRWGMLSKHDGVGALFYIYVAMIILGAILGLVVYEIAALFYRWRMGDKGNETK